MSRFLDLLSGAELDTEIVRRSDLRVQVPRTAPHPPPPSQTEFLWIFVDVLQRRKWTILGFFLFVVLLVSAASFLMKPRYEAVARIVFNRETANPLGFKDLGDMPQDDEYSVSLDTQVQILQSDTLAAQVIRELHLDQSGA